MNEQNLTTYQIANNYISDCLGNDGRNKRYLILIWILENYEKDRILIYKRFSEKFKLDRNWFRIWIKELLEQELVIIDNSKIILKNQFVSAIIKRKQEILEYFKKNFNSSMLSTKERMKLQSQTIAIEEKIENG